MSGAQFVKDSLSSLSRGQLCVLATQYLGNGAGSKNQLIRRLLVGPMSSQKAGNTEMEAIEDEIVEDLAEAIRKRDDGRLLDILENLEIRIDRNKYEELYSSADQDFVDILDEYTDSVAKKRRHPRYYK